MHRGHGVSADTSRTLRSARANFRERLSKFRSQQVMYMSLPDSEEMPLSTGDGYEDTDEEDVTPEEDDEDSAGDSGTEDDAEFGRLPKHGPELEILGLPSDLGADDFERIQCEGLALAELRIRLGLAYDLIAALKEAISRKSATVQSKRKHARGQKDNIAANSAITTVHVETLRLAGQYSDNFARMSSLSTRLNTFSVTTTIPKSLKAINVTTDLGISAPALPKKASNPGGFHLQDNRTLGDHNVVGAWIFHVAPPNDGTSDAQTQWESEGEYEHIF